MTISTVGYGDITPKTVPGYLMASVVIAIGIMIMALPIAVIGDNFSLINAYSKKRQARLAKAAVTEGKVCMDTRL